MKINPGQTMKQIKTMLLAVAALAAAQAMHAQSVWNAVVNSSTDTNWSSSVNWTPNSVPGSTANVVFNDTASALDTTVNNVVDGSFGGTISSLSYTNNVSGTFENTLIPGGVTLNVTGTGGLTAGSSTLFVTNVTTVATISGTGKLNVNNASANVYVAWGSGSSTPAETLNLAGLDTFNFTGARLMVGVAGANRSAGILFLAKTNTLTLTGSSPQIDIGDNGGNNGAGSTVNLGITNIIFADNISMGRSKQNTGNGGTLKFNPSFSGNNPVATFRGANGVNPVATWSIADGLTGGGTITCSGVTDLSGGTVDAKVTSMWLARNGSGATGTPTSTGTFTTGNGTFSVVNLTNAFLCATNRGPTVTGTINVNGSSGTLNVNNLFLASTNGLTGLGANSGVSLTAISTVNVNNGTLGAGNILAGGVTTTHASGMTVNLTTTINLNNGFLVITNFAGTLAAPLTALHLNSGELHVNLNASSIITNINATTVDASSGPVNIVIDSITNYPGSGTITFTYLKYNAGNGDPNAFGNLSFFLPAGFGGSFNDDAVNGLLTVTVTSGPNTLSSVGPLTWNGGGGDNNWTTSANWNGTNILAGDNLLFAGGTRLANNNDTPAASTYSGITFNSGAGAFILGGNPITIGAGGGVTNNASTTETVNVGLNIGANTTLEAGSGTLIIGRGVTNTASGQVTTTLGGTGILTNLFAGSSSNVLSTSTTANWTIVNNPGSTAVSAPVSFTIANGTFNFGNAGSAPNLTTVVADTTGAPRAVIGGSSGTSTFNMVNGNLTLGGRLNVGNSTATGILNVSGGTLTINGAGLSVADNASATIGTVNATAGTINLNGNTIYVATRGTGTLNISGSAQVTAGTLDVSRSAAGGSKGTANLNGGTLTVNLVSTATSSTTATNGTETATLNFNGGTLKAGATSATFITQSGIGGTGGPSNVVLNLFVKAGGAIIDNNGFNIGTVLPLQHDSGLGGTPDGGLTKNSSGTLTLSGASTYTGNTTVNGGTLALSGSGSIANSHAITVAGGAILDVSGVSFSLASGQILSNSTSTATINGNVGATAGGLGLNYGSGTPSFTLTSGTLTLGSGTTATVKNTGSALAVGSYTLISSGGGSVGGTAPSSVTVTGGGIAGGTSASLQVSGGQLNLVVASGGGSTPRLSGISLSGTTLSLHATNATPGANWTLLQATNLATPLAQWKTNRVLTFDGSGNLNTNIVNVATNAQTYYILKQ